MQLAFSNLTQQEPKHILYVENDLFFRDTLLPVLSGAGYRVTTTLSAAEAEELLDGPNRFDVVLVDAEMASREGGVLASLLRERLLSDDMPMIMLHEAGTPAVLSMASNHRMTSHVSKLDRQYLLNTLSSLLTAAERTSELGYLAKEMAA
jgi:two-component system, chemotaxis family, sensor kinase CheA